MLRTGRTKRFAVTGTLIGALLLPAMQAAAAPPSNDAIENAILAAPLPFTDSRDTSEATAAFDDPTTCTNNGSVWYTFTPSADGLLIADTFGSGYDTVLSIYTGSPGALGEIPGACNDDSSGTLQSRVSLQAAGGITLYFMVGFCCGFGGTGGGSLVFNLQTPAAAENDDFLNATTVTALPFSQLIDTSQATIEEGEPQPSCAFGLNGSVWYSFTPVTTGSLSAAVALGFQTVLAVYTGESLATLSEVGCRANFSTGPDNPVTFRAQAGVRYYFQTGFFGSSGGGTLRFDLNVAPAPVASFVYSPFDPSIFDEIQFSAQSFDPGQVDFESHVWNFGDGTTATDRFPTHTYATDGDYTVTITSTTFDGRADSDSQVVAVRTHDVAIVKIAVPTSAKVGQTRPITIDLRNLRYTDEVFVELQKTTTGGGFQIGTRSLIVPARNKTTTVSFNYTFTAEDARAGKVTFMAIASIIGARDALPGDNTAIATSTKVSN